MPLALRTFALLLALGALGRAAQARADAFALAAEHYRQKRWDRASEEFSKLLRDDPGHARADDARFYCGESLAQLGRWREAREQFAELLRRNPPTRHARGALFRAGEAAYMLGDDPAALNALRAFRAKYPDDTLDAYVLPYLGSLELQSGDAARAEQTFAAALARFPAGPLAAEAKFGLAQSYHQAGRLDEAAKAYREVVSRNAPLSEQALLQLATAENARGDFQAALAALDQFAAQFPASPLADKAQLGRGYALYRLDRHAEALAVLEPLADRAGVGVEAAYWTALSQKAQQQWPAAAATLSRIAPSPDHPLAPAIAFHHADALRRGGAPADAAREIDAALARFGNSAWADDLLLGRLRIAAEQEDYAAAVDLADRLTSRFADSPLAPSAQLAKGQALVELKRPAEAIDVLRPLDTAGSPADAELVARARASLAVATAQTKQFDEAQRLAQQLSADPAFAELASETAYLLGEIARASGQAALAETLFASAAGGQGNPIARRAQSGLAWSHFEAGRWAEAADAFEELLAADPEGPQAAEAALLRGLSLERLEKYDQAQALYADVVARFPSSPRAAEARLRAARLHEQLGKSEAALAEYAALIAAEGDVAERDAALYRHALLLLPKDPAAAETELRRLLAEHAGSRYAGEARLLLAERALDGKQLEEARQWLAELTTPDAARDLPAESQARAWYLSGRLEMAGKRYGAAADQFNRLLAQFPNDASAGPAEYLLAEAEFQQGQYEPALERLARLSQQAAGRDDAFLAQAELRRAQALAQLRRWDEAAQVASAIATRFPDFDRRYEADYLVGRAHAAKAEFSVARQWYAKVLAESAVVGTETAAMARWMTGESHFHQEHFQEALAEYQQVDASHPRWHAAALLQAGKCQERLGDWSAAAACYERLLSAQPDGELASEAKGRLETARSRAAKSASRARTRSQ